MSTLYLLVGFIILLTVATSIAILIGYFIAKNYQTDTERSFNRPPQVIFDTLRNVGGYAEWRKLVTEITEEDTGWRLSYKANPVDSLLVLSEEQAPTKLVFTGNDIDGPTQWSWTMHIDAEGETGSRVRVVEKGTVNNAWYRFVMKHVSGYDKTIVDLLRDLDLHLSA